MNITPIEHLSSLQIGTVDFVSPDEIKVQLDTEAPESIALNAGLPRPFPRINSYVLIHNEEGFIVGQIEWITIERSTYPKRQGFKDFGLIDLPFPLRKMSLNPIGTLSVKNISSEDYIFHRGVNVFPSVGDSVLLPTQNQLKTIIESGENRRVKIGMSPLAENAEVMIDPDKLFGRHLAVLGNTGSGKSCTVAGLIRWSLDQAKKDTKKDCLEGVDENKKNQNARFIILDPNGEYHRAFQDHENARIFSVEVKGNEKPLNVPLWFWNSLEWGAFTQASERSHRPLLKRALREIRNGGSQPLTEDFELRRKITSILISLRSQIRNGANYEGWKLGPKLQTYKTDLEAYTNQYNNYKDELEKIVTSLDIILKEPSQTYKKQNGSMGYNDFAATKLDVFDSALSEFLITLGGILYQEGPNEDSPIPFDGLHFADHIETLAEQENNPQFFDYFIMRIKTMLSDTRMKPILENKAEITLDKWLLSYIGDNSVSDNTISIIDLSLVPADIIHIVTAVVSRMIFESLQRYRKLHKEHKSLPTVLVMEEAHNFIKRYNDDFENQTASAICCQIFERIAREGRKFGLGLVLSSQRPSELSPTVLSQCNTFILHRISNDRDQELVLKLVPDNSRGLLRDLPSLPSQNAILLGWAVELPLLVRMNTLPRNQQPQSEDPDFWDVWTGKQPREVNWEKIANDWQQINKTDSKNEGVDQED
jgi:DNA helicase HerA-like ATPase